MRIRVTLLLVQVSTSMLMPMCMHLYRSDEGLTLETSDFLLFTVANLRIQLSC